jgi:coenzyme F420-reducing hydrogenase delta subunit
MGKKVVVIIPSWGIKNREKFPSSVELRLEKRVSALSPHCFIEPFLEGAEGVFGGDASSGEEDKGKRGEAIVDIVSAVILWLGISPFRFHFQQVSKKEGEAFDPFIEDFLERIATLPPLSQEILKEKLERKIEAAKKGLSGKKLPLLLSKRAEFMEKGNVFGERFTHLEIKRMFYDVVSDELTGFELMSLLGDSAYSVPELASVTDIPQPRILRQLVDLKRFNKVDIIELQGKTPKWGSPGLKRG